MDMVKKYWWIVAIVFGIGGWVAHVDMSLASNTKKVTKQDATIERLDNLIAQQAELLKKMDGKIDVVLVLLGVKRTDSIAQEWIKMPMHPTMGIQSVPIEGCEWLCISDDYLLGRTMKWVNGKEVMVRTEWDERHHNDE